MSSIILPHTIIDTRDDRRNRAMYLIDTMSRWKRNPLVRTLDSLAILSSFGVLVVYRNGHAVSEIDPDWLSEDHPIWSDQHVGMYLYEEGSSQEMQAKKQGKPLTILRSDAMAIQEEAKRWLRF